MLKLNKWKDGFEKKVMKVNINKTKVLIGWESSEDADKVAK